MTLGRNILWNLAAFVWFSLLTILVTPYMVRRLGLEAFGLWAVITAFGGYVGAVDLGLGNALIRFLATENERGDRKTLERYLRSGVSLQAGLGVLGALFLLLGSQFITHRWIRVSPELIPVAVLSFRLSAISVLLGFLVTTYAGVPTALNRFDLIAVRTILLFSLQYLSVVWVLHRGGGLPEVVGVYVLGTAAILVYLVIVSHRLLPGVNVWPGWHPQSVRELLRFGRMKFPAQLSVTLLQQFDRVALGAFRPLAMVSFYVVPLRIAQRLGQISENVAGPFYPTIAAHLVADRVLAMRRQYRQGTRMVMAAVCGAVSVLGGLAAPILAVWMGDEFARQGTWPFRLLLLAYGASALFTLPSVAADAAGRPGIPAFFLVSGALLHVVVILILVPHWGLPGAAAGVLCGFLLPLLWGVPAIHRRIQPLPPLTAVLGDVRGAFFAGVLTLVLSAYVSRSGLAGTGWIPLLLFLCLCSGVYLLLVFAFRGIKFEDIRGVVRLVLPEGRKV